MYMCVCERKKVDTNYTCTRTHSNAHERIHKTKWMRNVMFVCVCVCVCVCVHICIPAFADVLQARSKER